MENCSQIWKLYGLFRQYSHSICTIFRGKLTPLSSILPVVFVVVVVIAMVVAGAGVD